VHAAQFTYLNGTASPKLEQLFLLLVKLFLAVRLWKHYHGNF